MNHYRIRLADPSKDHWLSQARTGSVLRKSGFYNLLWTMGSGLRTGESTHDWKCIGDEEMHLRLKLSAHVVEVELLETNIVNT